MSQVSQTEVQSPSNPYFSAERVAAGKVSVVHGFHTVTPGAIPPAADSGFGFALIENGSADYMIRTLNFIIHARDNATGAILQCPILWTLSNGAAGAPGVWNRINLKTWASDALVQMVLNTTGFIAPGNDTSGFSLGTTGNQIYLPDFYLANGDTRRLQIETNNGGGFTYPATFQFFAHWSVLIDDMTDI